MIGLYSIKALGCVARIFFKRYFRLEGTLSRVTTKFGEILEKYMINKNVSGNLIILKFLA